jgi:hypothetical protein
MDLWPRRAARAYAAWVCALALASCSSGSSGAGDAAAASDNASVDVATTVDTADAGAADSAFPAGTDCPGGAYCPCDENADCDGGFRMDTLAGRRCAAACVDACPDGFRCQKASGADELFWCVPTWGLYCRPCFDDKDCDAAGVSDAACVRFGDAGGFCGSACSGDDDCPAGASCQTVQRVEGGQVQQCVSGPTASAPPCACSSAAQLAQWKTACWLTEQDDAGGDKRRCKGVRGCGVDGLAPCLPLTGEAQLCVDVQCSEPGSGGTIAKADGSPCDDGEACTANDTCAAGACVGGTYTCACDVDADCKDDGNLCNGVPYCDKSGESPVCAINGATVVTCDISADTHCEKTVCLPSTGACAKVPALAGEACSDGVACTVDDHCDGKGTCLAGADTCPCKTTADCKDDGDLCNGVPFCDNPASPPSCKANPATVVTCDTSADTACVKATCDPKTAACAPVVLPDKTACDDGDSCTGSEVCEAGSCEGVALCTCTSLADCAAYEDGDACNGTLYCDGPTKSCKVNPATVMVCPSVDDTACQKNQCDSKKGACAMKPTVALCEDGNPCSIDDVCEGGACVAGTNTCTCEVDADCASKEDGNVCNGTLFCDKSVGLCAVNPATKVVCPNAEDTACLRNTCTPATGACAMAVFNEGGACSDGNACTTGDKCSGGSCVSDGNVCACQGDADCIGKDDGNLCDGTLFCDKKAGKCVPNPASVPSCPSANDDACAANQCVHTFGLAGEVTGTTCAMVPRPDGLPCDDGKDCTENDQCKTGVCVAGKKVCNCQTDADCAPAGPKNLCAGTPKCELGDCKQTGGKTCDDSADTVCLANACTPTTGECAMMAVNQGKACNDGDACSAESSCSEGACVADVLINCDDGNVCTADACDAKAGCTNTAVVASASKAAACDDGDACTVNGQCVDKVCKSEPAKEVCEGSVDEDCDGVTDEQDAVGCKAFYFDNDGDGWGTAASQCLCGAAGKYSVAKLTTADCNDNDKGVHPGATEVCNGKDDNCAGGADENGASGCTMYWYDGDGDGWTKTIDNKQCRCTSGEGYTTTNTSDFDCNDGDKKIHPGAEEICDSIDHNFDGDPYLAGLGVATQNLSGCTKYYRDVDGDGFAAGTYPSRCLCGADSINKYTTFFVGDCDDSDKNARPFQASYFSVKSKGGTWDYNCNGKVEPKWGSGDCPGNSSCMSKLVPGFLGTPPACGGAGKLVTGCAKKPVQCKLSSSSPATQTCR